MSNMKSQGVKCDKSITSGGVDVIKPKRKKKTEGILGINR